MHTRFLHTSDWQLGVTRTFLGGDAQARWSEARFEGVRQLGRLAVDQQCEFIVVAGDVFETNQVNRRTVLKAGEAMAAIPMPIFLLPGNHDPLDAGSVFTSALWKARCPPNVRVLDRPGDAIEVRPGIEVTGAPWTSKRPLCDLVAAAAASLEPARAALRVMVAHGAVDEGTPNLDNPALISVADATAALREGRYHYLALGDRHSRTEVGANGRIRYCGTHEAFDFREIDPGNVLVVDLSAEQCAVTAHTIGTWGFPIHEARLTSEEDVEALARVLDAMPDKARTIIKLGLVGTLGLNAHVRLEAVLDHARELFAAVVRSDSRSELVVLPENTDFDQLALAGFAATAVEKLRALAASAGPDRDRAADALALMVRLAGRSA